jgi:hypothetical protein
MCSNYLNFQQRWHECELLLYTVFYKCMCIFDEHWLKLTWVIATYTYVDEHAYPCSMKSNCNSKLFTIYIQTYIHTYVHTYIYMYVCVCMYTCTYIRTCMYDICTTYVRHNGHTRIHSALQNCTVQKLYIWCMNVHTYT